MVECARSGCKTTSSGLVTRKKNHPVEEAISIWQPVLPHHTLQWYCREHSTVKISSAEEARYGCLELVPAKYYFDKLEHITIEDWKEVPVRTVNYQNDDASQSLFCQNLKFPVLQAQQFLQDCKQIRIYGNCEALRTSWRGDCAVYNKLGKPRPKQAFYPDVFFSEEEARKQRISQQISNASLGQLEIREESNKILSKVFLWNPPPKEWLDDVPSLTQHGKEYASAESTRSYNPNQATFFCRSVGTGLLSMDYFHCEAFGMTAMNMCLPFILYSATPEEEPQIKALNGIQMWRGGFVRGCKENIEMLKLTLRSWSIGFNDYPSIKWFDKVGVKEIVSQAPGQVVYSRQAKLNDPHLDIQYHSVTGTDGLCVSIAQNIRSTLSPANMCFLAAERLIEGLQPDVDTWRRLVQFNNFISGLQHLRPLTAEASNYPNLKKFMYYGDGDRDVQEVKDKSEVINNADKLRVGPIPACFICQIALFGKMVSVTDSTYCCRCWLQHQPDAFSGNQKTASGNQKTAKKKRKADTPDQTPQEPTIQENTTQEKKKKKSSK